jgi:hypothetical protein
MWYDYIGEEKCGWRVVRKGPIPSALYNYMNHKKELLFTEWVDYAETFNENTQLAMIGRTGVSGFDLINNKGEIIETMFFPF